MKLTIFSRTSYINQKHPVDNFVDKSAVSVDKSAKSVDNFVDNFLPKKSYPQENRFIHISSTDLSTGKIDVCNLFLITKKSYPQKMPSLIIIIF